MVKQFQDWDTGIAGIDIKTTQDMNGMPVYISLFTHEAGSDKKKLLFFSTVERNKTAI